MMETGGYSMAKDIISRAAAALDATHSKGERGPRTYQARQRVALALDLGRKPSLVDIVWLERIGRG